MVKSKLKNLIEELQRFRDEKAVPTYYAFKAKDETQDPNVRKIIQNSKDL